VRSRSAAIRHQQRKEQTPLTTKTMAITFLIYDNDNGCTAAPATSTPPIPVEKSTCMCMDNTIGAGIIPLQWADSQGSSSPKLRKIASPSANLRKTA